MRGRYINRGNEGFNSFFNGEYVDYADREDIMDMISL